MFVKLGSQSPSHLAKSGHHLPYLQSFSRALLSYARWFVRALSSLWTLVAHFLQLCTGTGLCKSRYLDTFSSSRSFPFSCPHHCLLPSAGKNDAIFFDLDFTASIDCKHFSTNHLHITLVWWPQARVCVFAQMDSCPPNQPWTGIIIWDSKCFEGDDPAQ